MNYLIVYDEGYGNSILYEFDTRTEADAFLFDKIVLSGYAAASDYTLYEYTQTFDVDTAVRCYAEKRDELKARALAKLTTEEKAILGLA